MGNSSVQRLFENGIDNDFIALQAEAVSSSSARTDRERLCWLGERLDFRSSALNGDTVAMWLGRVLLRLRDRKGDVVPLEANTAQQAYEQRRGKRNIILKARQMGISTWVAGRFSSRPLRNPGL